MSNPDQNKAPLSTEEFEDKLEGIANDSALNYQEKVDAISEATEEQIGGVAASTAGAAVPSADVTGDPDTATYSTDTATTQATATAGEQATATAPAQATSSAPQATTATPQTSASAEPDLNAAIGLDGTVDYFSPRDVDGDGTVDVTHSRVDGIDTITHYDDDGHITLIEQDRDFNGTYETAASVRPDGTVRVAMDTDDDGRVDQANFYDRTTGHQIREDSISGGRITGMQLDSDGDGQPDIHLIDSDGDGRFDTVALDTDGDGIVNVMAIDTDGDGKFDLMTSDNDNDGTLESFVTANGEGVGSLGSIDAFETLIPADDAYHAQAHTDHHEPPALDHTPGEIV